MYKVLKEHPSINTQIILDSGCLFHLINTHEDIENFIQNDDKDNLGLGSVHFGIGTLASITGYGNKTPLGRMLVVPQLIPHMILSVGALASQGCKIELKY